MSDLLATLLNVALWSGIFFALLRLDRRLRGLPRRDATATGARPGDGRAGTLDR